MATPVDSSKSGNVYFNDPESGAEMARLLNQDYLVTKGMEGLFAERSNDFSGIQRILDVACGPGGWVQEVAFAHPEMDRLYEQMLLEMQQDDFRGLMLPLTAWGEKAT